MRVLNELHKVCISILTVGNVKKTNGKVAEVMSLADAVIGEEYIVKDIEAEDEELKAFLFSLGCYSGEPITVNSHIKGGCVVSIKDARYNIDVELARAISI